MVKRQFCKLENSARIRGWAPFAPIDQVAGHDFGKVGMALRLSLGAPILRGYGIRAVPEPSKLKKTCSSHASRSFILTLSGFDLYNRSMYKDPEEQRKYQRGWAKKRRDEWLSANGPCRRCGTWNRLEVDHIDPSQKVAHTVWNWRKERREAELVKCQPLCHDCHRIKTTAQIWRPITHGTAGGYARGCRCDACSAYQVNRMVAYHATHPRRKSFANVAQSG